MQVRRSTVEPPHYERTNAKLPTALVTIGEAALTWTPCVLEGGLNLDSALFLSQLFLYI